MYPTTIRNLIEGLKKIPGIGEKSAERYALSILSLDDEIIDLLSTSIRDIKVKTKRCKKCNNFAEDELCEICKDKTRNNKILCVVEEPKNVKLFESVDSYHGLYHVLDGLISPLEGINPEDINIKSLVERIENEKIEEVIIAVRPSVEGETTALYISKILEGMNVVVSKIAYGIPIGADMEYIDSLTLEMALEDRKKISE